jgi:phosphohistidine phosphatase
MKTLCLIRHAKSSWNDEYVEDFERLLNQRGLNDAPEMGKRLMQIGFRPDLVVSSPAFRAMSTARRIARELAYDAQQIVADTRIYDASLNRLIEVVQGLPDEADTIALIGHNPGMHRLGHHLTGMAPEEFPTCAVFMIDFTVSTWSDVSPLCGELKFYDFPKSSE